jgi:hypothetical protein
MSDYGYIQNTGAYAEEFQSEVYPDNVVRTSGSLLLVKNLPSDKFEPETATITVNQSNTAPAQGDTTIDVNSDVDVTLRKGEILTFSSGDPVIVASKQTVTSTTASLTVEPLSSNPPADTDTAVSWGLLRALSPQALPLTIDNNNVDRKDYSMGLQGQEVKTRVNFTSSVQLINQLDDEAYHSVILPASQSAENIYAVIITGSQHGFGAVQVSGASDDNSLDEISRPSFDLMFQRSFAVTGSFQSLSADRQNDLNEVRKRAGLAELS